MRLVRSRRPLDASVSSMRPISASTSAQRLARRGRANPQFVRRRIRIADPHEGDVGANLVEAERQVSVHGAAIARRIRPRGRRRRPELLDDVRGEFLRQRELVVNDGAAGDRVVQEQRRAARPRPDGQNLPARALQNLAERRRRQQILLGLRDHVEVRARAGVEAARRVDARDVDGVAEQAMRLGIRAGGQRGGIHARYGRIDGVVRVEDDASAAEAQEPRHQIRRDVVGPQAVDDDHEMRGAWRRLRTRRHGGGGNRQHSRHHETPCGRE